MDPAEHSDSVTDPLLLNYKLYEDEICLVISHLVSGLFLAQRAQITCRLVFPSAHKLLQCTYLENVPCYLPDQQGPSFPLYLGLFSFLPLGSSTVSSLSVSLVPV
ncbi:hypothetical protein AMECASPLE_028879 [Ameca splendens]|uniref:Uncharacterized protein n=1 Tax=Ameca splendens TaxID=208324 RepID=A0ABV0YSN1_9TELE